jgi:hypothetical protein
MLYSRVLGSFWTSCPSPKRKPPSDASLVPEQILHRVDIEG